MTMLKCGCRAVGSVLTQTGERVPYCLIHNCYELMPEPDLTGRKARCAYCLTVVESSTSLPFFSLRDDHEFDSYYCGCRGWD